jgi:hypothetical protein
MRVGRFLHPNVLMTKAQDSYTTGHSIDKGRLNVKT